MKGNTTQAAQSRQSEESAASVRGAEASERCIVISPNCSLSGREAMLFVALVGGTTLGVALFFAAQGFWPILPFAGAEVALLTWAVMHTQRRARYREVLRVGVADVTLERGYTQGEDRVVFSRSWVRPRLTTGRWQECRVHLASHGRSVEVGACLSTEERRALYKRLRQVLRDAT